MTLPARHFLQHLTLRLAVLLSASALLTTVILALAMRNGGMLDVSQVGASIAIVWLPGAVAAIWSMSDRRFGQEIGTRP